MGAALRAVDPLQIPDDPFGARSAVKTRWITSSIWVTARSSGPQRLEQVVEGEPDQDFDQRFQVRVGDVGQFIAADESVDLTRVRSCRHSEYA
ncbi:hypothetical protein ACWDYH_20685 [Nocardia goodfellowii]